jgi:hypothetical protein
MPDKKKTKATTRKPAAPAVKKVPSAKGTAKARAAPKARPVAGAKAVARAKAAPKARPVAAAKPAAKAKAKEAPGARPVANARAVAKAKAVVQAKAVAKAKAVVQAKADAKAKPVVARPTGPDPEGFFVARIRGEDAVRDAPRQMLERGGFDEEPRIQAELDEGLGDLPWTYGDDALIALPRDPHTLFIYWDHAQATLASAFAGLDHPHAQIWLFVRGAGWERVRVVDFALESRGYYLHDLEPGRVYRAEIHVVDRRGQDRVLPHTSNAMLLPPHGPSPVVDDRFINIPWALPLPRLLGAGVPGGPFSEELRALLARLSDWARFLEGQQAGTGGGTAVGAGGMGGRPTSRGGPVGPKGHPSSPSSPFGPFGGEGR